MQLATLTPAIPEIIVALGAMVLLMIGAFRPAKDPAIAARDGQIIVERSVLSSIGRASTF